MRKLPITLLAIGLLVILLFWLWPSTVPSSSIDSSDGQVANAAVSGELPLPVQNAKASSLAESEWQSHALGSEAEHALNENDHAVLIKDFESANTLLSQRNFTEAQQQYLKLTQDFPNFVEPYVNLASIQAELGELAAARETLLRAAQANQSTKVLFDSLDKVHGALAAQAYRNALENNVASQAQVILPKIKNLANDFELAQKVTSLQERLDQEKSKQASLAANSEALADAQSKLDASNAKLAKLEEEQKLLQSELVLEAEKRELATTQLSNLKQQAVDAETDLVAKLRIELASSELSLNQSLAKLRDLEAANSELNQRIVLAEAAKNVTPVKPTDVPKAAGQSEKEVAIGLVKGWAKAWSDQNVAGYLSFYKPDYSSSSNLSRTQWEAQRRIRLTNKAFIKVDVRDFLVIATTNGFSVTFTQHYRSNTLDDTIRKRIEFEKQSDAAWSSAKIVSEKIVKR